MLAFNIFNYYIVLLLNKGKRPIIQDFKGRTKNIILLKKEPRTISKDLKVKFY